MRRTGTATMLTVSEALQNIVDSVSLQCPAPVELSNALGLILADDVVSDIDVPPFDKSLMDGYAVRSADVSQVPKVLSVVEEVTAGRVPTKNLSAGEATRIMTGAPLPDGADAVVRVEETTFDEATGQVSIGSTVSAGTDLMRRGYSLKKGTAVVTAGTTLRPQEIGTLAEQGVDQVSVRRRPTVSILATGDELVPVGQTPGPGQIRNSNESMLVAQVQAMGGIAQPLGIARDNREELSKRINLGLKSDILLLSGGVSAGKLDLVPSTLAAAGVEQRFHKVQLKPGKPIWYGVLQSKMGDSASQASCCHVFGLPGNPVSSMVCCELFVRTCVQQLLGVKKPTPKVVSACLEKTYQATGGRAVYHPAQLYHDGAKQLVRLINWKGSADLSSTNQANAMVCFPAEEKMYSAGVEVETIEWSK